MQRVRPIEVLIAVILAAALVLAGSGCGRDDKDRKSAGAATQAAGVMPAHVIEYSFAADLGETHPQQVEFLRHFLETCIAGDYEGYRRLVATGIEPESRNRFERMLRALRRIDVESIESIEAEQLPRPAFLVVGKVTFVPEEEARRPRIAGGRRVALLLAQEDGEWRTALAPEELQPGADAATYDAPPTTGPSYPWDESP